MKTYKIELTKEEIDAMHAVLLTMVLEYAKHDDYDKAGLLSTIGLKMCEAKEVCEAKEEQD